MNLFEEWRIIKRISKFLVFSIAGTLLGLLGYKIVFSGEVSFGLGVSILIGNLIGALLDIKLRGE